MTPFEALQIRYRKLKTQYDKETEENYNKLFERIDILESENRILKELINNPSIWEYLKLKYLNKKDTKC